MDIGVDSVDDLLVNASEAAGELATRGDGCIVHQAVTHLAQQRWWKSPGIVLGNFTLLLFLNGLLSFNRGELVWIYRERSYIVNGIEAYLFYE